MKALDVALLLAVCPAALWAQSPSDSSHVPKLAVALAVGRESHAPGLLLQSPCGTPHPTRVETSFRASLTRWVFVEGVVGMHDRPSGDCVVVYAPILPGWPPYPPGPFTVHSRNVEGRIGKYPMVTTDVRLGVQVRVPPGLWTWRLSAGPMWIWSKDLAGASGELELAFNVPDQPVQLIGGLTALWYAIPYTDVVAQYMDGVLTSMSATPGRMTATPVVLSLGIAVTF